MTTNPHPQYRQDRCEHCRAGMPLYVDEPGYHIARSGPSKCQAPTPEAYIAELLDKIDLLVYGWNVDASKVRAERDQARAALKVATDALNNARANLDSLIDTSVKVDDADLYCVSDIVCAALSTEAVAAELARQKAQADELASLRRQLADADRINAGIARGRT